MACARVVRAGRRSPSRDRQRQTRCDAGPRHRDPRPGSADRGRTAVADHLGAASAVAFTGRVRAAAGRAAGGLFTIPEFPRGRREWKDHLQRRTHERPDQRQRSNVFQAGDGDTSLCGQRLPDRAHHARALDHLRPSAARPRRSRRVDGPRRAGPELAHCGGLATRPSTRCDARADRSEWNRACARPLRRGSRGQTVARARCARRVRELARRRRARSRRCARRAAAVGSCADDRRRQRRCDHWRVEGSRLRANRSAPPAQPARARVGNDPRDCGRMVRRQADAAAGRRAGRGDPPARVRRSRRPREVDRRA